MPNIRAADVFAGLGGMSLGAMRAGLDVRVAVEIDASAAATYRANHLGSSVLEKDVRCVSGAELKAAAGGGDIQLLMGCAPCQGFSSLTSKYKREDERNLLVLELARLAEELQPECVVMENVPGLAQKGKPLLDEVICRLEAQGYSVVSDVLQMADFGVPQRRRRFVLVAAKNSVPTLPSPTHSNPLHVSRTKLPPWRTVRQAVPGLGAPVQFQDAIKKGSPQDYNWHVVSTLTDITKARLRAAIPGASRLDIDARLLPDCHQDGYSGFSNVYTRMDWDSPSPTITAGCLTPAKGRFGHPDRRRWTLSLREAARLQTLPDDFKICSDRMEEACRMVGNAVPPVFAELLFRHILKSVITEAKESPCKKISH